jgi:hypothetical protein
MRMEFMDEASRSRFLKVEISPENLLVAITSLGDQDCEFELRACEYVGKQQEVKTIHVPGISGDRKTFDDELGAAVKPFEIDGWRADRGGGYNHYRQSKEGYEVWFRRYVGEGLGYERVT